MHARAASHTTPTPTSRLLYRSLEQQLAALDALQHEMAAPSVNAAQVCGGGGGGG